MKCTNSFIKSFNNHLLNMDKTTRSCLKKLIVLCVFVCGCLKERVCVCKREKQRQREREREVTQGSERSVQGEL